jgi:hypothetical protein
MRTAKLVAWEELTTNKCQEERGNRKEKDRMNEDIS